ncbi:MAG TPA: flagellar hook-basal body protein [Phycisphaerales bacterium]|nr:flagellar hook-basal body protein [Phycisphaerales bacterium]
MNYGLYLSASGVLNSMYRQDVQANNLANINTVGFKPDIPVVKERLTAREEAGGMPGDIQNILEQLGGGLFGDQTRVSTAQGSLLQTTQPFDLALNGNGFFTVSDGNGTNEVRLTRDGRMGLNDQGELVMMATGNPVLDTGGGRIKLDPTKDLVVNSDGTIRQGGAKIAKLRIAGVSDPRMLVKRGNNLLSVNDPTALADATSTTKVQQGYTEDSATDPVMTLNEMINAARAAQANAQLMQYHDHVMGEAVNSLGRVG